MLESQGALLEIENTAATPAFVAVGQVTSIQGLGGGQAAVIDTSHLQSTRREKLMGLADEGQVTVNLLFAPGDAGQIELKAGRNTRAVRSFRLTLSDGTIFAFSGFVLSFPKNLGVDQVVQGDVTIEITGEVTETPAP